MDDQRRIARKMDRLDELGRVRYCDTHDLPIERNGRCVGCFIDDEDQARTNADIDRQWRTR